MGPQFRAVDACRIDSILGWSVIRCAFSSPAGPVLSDGGPRSEACKERGDQPVVLSRKAEDTRNRLRTPAMRPVQVVQGDPSVADDGWDSSISTAATRSFNLVGHNIFEDRWNAHDQAEDPRQPRLFGTENVVAAIAQGRHSRPKTLVQGLRDRLLRPSGETRIWTESSSVGLPTSWPLFAASGKTPRIRPRPSACGWRSVRTGVVLAKGEGRARRDDPHLTSGSPAARHLSAVATVRSTPGTLATNG